ncbi:leucine-rich repeat-containing protein 15-like, partial [Drosophila busckii]
TEITAIPSYGVKNLYLSNNQITSIALGAFQNLTELAKLDLSNNKLSANDLKPDVFKGKYSEHDFLPMKNLKFLNLGCNLLHTLNADLFEHVPNLEELVLCSNTFTAIDRSTEAAVSGLLELKVLDISYMKVMTLPETIFHGPQKLEDLIASGNLFIELPKALSFAVNLKRLVLDENPIQNLEAKNVFPTLRKLQYLSIAYMPDIYKIGPGAFKELQNLKELILSDNQMLSEIDEQAFCKNVTGGEYLDYPPLEKLYLRNCKLTKLPQKLIRRWDKLNVLDLRMNPWTCDSSNEYMINYLMKQVNKSTPKLAGNVKCEFPEKLKGLEALQLSNEKLIDSSASDGLIWISLMIFILLAIPIILAGIVLHKRGFFRWHKKNDVSNRALYSRASFNEDVHI